MKVTPERAALILRRRALTFEREVRRAETEILAQAQRMAVDLSSGGYTSAMLRRMGHPYATRRPAPPQSAAIINAQTGLFRGSWRTSGPRRTGSGFKSTLENTAGYAALLFQGTEVMIPRPIRERIAARMRALRYRRHRKALAGANRAL
jgi:hypothetical protein